MARQFPSSSSKLTLWRMSGPAGLYRKLTSLTSTTAAAPFQQQIEEHRRAEEGRDGADGQLHGRYYHAAEEVGQQQKQRAAAAEQGSSQR